MHSRRVLLQLQGKSNLVRCKRTCASTHACVTEAWIAGRNARNPNLTQVDLRTWICDRVRCRVFNGTAKKVKQKAGGFAQVALALRREKHVSGTRPFVAHSATELVYCSDSSKSMQLLLNRKHVRNQKFILSSTQKSFQFFIRILSYQREITFVY